uniref:Ig-like domain-containing protein n=1 Tax=Panagrellus redivivus TaxID=6233 RepID=A0A7E4W5V5_PANRE
MHGFTKVLVIAALLVGAADAQCRHDGSTYNNGQEWKERNSFVMKCTVNDNGSWKTEVTACVAPNGNKININTTLEDGNTQWRCSINDRGMVTLVQEANPNAKCDGHPVGSRWTEKSFELECLPGGARKLISCVTEEGVKVPVNQSKEVNGFTLVCQSFPNGTVSFHGQKAVTVPKPAEGSKPAPGGGPVTQGKVVVHCADEQNVEHRAGEHWIENHRFNKTCRADGSVEVVNCITKEGLQIPLNQNIVKDGSKYTCEKTSQGTIRFSAAPLDDVKRFRRFFI